MASGWYAGSQASYGPYHGLELPHHGINNQIMINQLIVIWCHHMADWYCPAFIEGMASCFTAPNIQHYALSQFDKKLTLNMQGLSYPGLKVHSHWRVRACGSALRVPHRGPAPNVHTWIKRECSHWCVQTCGPACGEKSAECHAVISRTRKLFFGLFMTFWGLEN